MLQASLRIVPPAGKYEEVRNLMRAIQGPTVSLAGCCVSRVMQDVGNDGGLTYVVQWETQKQLEDYIRSARFRKLLPYIELSVQPPEFHISSMDRTDGMAALIGVLGS